VGVVVVDQLLFQFSICGSVPEIFAIKVESCHKPRKILDGYLPSQILGGRPSKYCTQVITPGSRHVVWIKICDDIPIRSELMDVYTLNFKPNFKFSRLKFFGGPPSQWGCALGSLGQFLARVKISGRCPLKDENTVSREMHTTVGQYSRQSITFSFVDQSSKTFLTQRGRGRS